VILTLVVIVMVNVMVVVMVIVMVVVCLFLVIVVSSRTRLTKVSPSEIRIRREFRNPYGLGQSGLSSQSRAATSSRSG
jgi:uncharacterized membrane protein YqiK